MAESAGSGKQGELLDHAEQLAALVRSAAREGTAAHEVEHRVWRRLLLMGRETMAMFFDLMGNGDMGEQVELEDGRRLRRLRELHHREYRSVFGTFDLLRAVYGTREGQKIEFVPLDTRLRLPAGKYSYLLQDWDQSLAVEEPFAKDSETLNRILGLSQPVDSLERMNRKMSESVPAFWDSLPSPAPSEEGEVMVISADGKGVPMRRPANGAPIEDHQPRKGPKEDGKKVALLGAAYTVDRFPRTPVEVLKSLFRDPAQSPAQPPRPQPQHKRIRASLERSQQGTTGPAFEEIFAWLAAENQARNPSGQKPLVVLMDGQEPLWDAAQTYLPQGDNTIDILDLLHATPRVWQAAYLFYPERSPPAIEFVKDRVLRILNGEVGSVITGLRRMATGRRLRGKKLKTLQTICGYFERNRHRMRYEEYLAAGYPIATGVIEGACRHLVKDRMERAGMRWVLQGAQAMLHLRSIHIADQWDDFIAFRIFKENQRLYPHVKLTEGSAWPITV